MPLLIPSIRNPPSSGQERGPLCKVVESESMAPEHPTCPRCDSGNTKFCYYNNYNLSQPRYLCKSCRRYWTLGGSLRNVPAGGTSRKNASAAGLSAKRRRGRPPSSSPPSPPSPPSRAPRAVDGANGQGITDTSVTDMSGTFAAVLEEPLPSGFLALGDPLPRGGTGFELDVCLGLGGMQEMALEPGKTASAPAWPFSADCGGEVVGGIGDAWKFTGEDPSGPGGDDGGFSWPDLAISTPGKSVR